MSGIMATQLVAHRGYQKHYPENTLLAIRQAIAAGALHIELDVQLSRDQVPVIYHDDSLQRMSGRAGKVSECLAVELQTCRAYEPERFGQRFKDESIAPLAALVLLAQQHRTVTFYVELKEEAVRDHGAVVCLQRMARVLAPVMAQCVLISFDTGALALAFEHGFTRIGVVTRDWVRRDEQIRALQASVLFVNKKRIPEGEVIVASCPVVVYEVEDIEEAKRWLQRGASKVETFAIGEMLGKAVLEQTGAVVVE